MLVVYLIKTTIRLSVIPRRTVNCATSAEKHCLKMALPLLLDSRTNRYKMWTASKSGDNENKLRTGVDSSRKHLDKPRIQHSLCIILSFAKRKHLCLTCFSHFFSGRIYECFLFCARRHLVWIVISAHKNVPNSGKEFQNCACVQR